MDGLVHPLQSQPSQSNPTSTSISDQLIPKQISSAGAYAKKQEEDHDKQRHTRVATPSPSAPHSAVVAGSSRFEGHQLSTSRVCIDHLQESPAGKAITLADIREHMEATGRMVINKDVRISQDHREQYPIAVRDKIYKLTFFLSPVILNYQLKMQGDLNPSMDQPTTVYVKSDPSDLQDYGYLRLPRQVEEGKTVLRLADWIKSDNAMPSTFGGDDVCLRARTRIIGVACALANTVHSFHLKNITMCGSLSPENVFLREKQHLDGPATYEVFIEDFSSTNIEDAFVAPWLKRIPRGTWWPHKLQAESGDDSRLLWLAIKEADIWSLGAIFWALCEGGVSFMNERYDGQKFMLKAANRVKSCGRWKFFALTYACFQGIEGDKEIVCEPCPRFHNIQRICDYLKDEADGEYEFAIEIISHVRQVEAYIAEDNNIVRQPM